MPGDAYPVLPRTARRPLSSAPAIALLAAIAMGMAACSGGATNTRPAGGSSAAALYQAGHEAMQQGDFAGAAGHFRTLETLYPGDTNTLQGQVELIYAYHKQDEIAAVLVTAERFIHDHPDYPSVDYVHYLRGLTLFNKAIDALGQDSVEIRPRPPAADLALEYFNVLIRNFPASKYADDARNRVLHLQNGLAAFELATAKIYISRGDYINAGLHARAVLENYPDANVKTEAATVTNMAYRMLALQNAEPTRGAAAALPAETIRPDVEVTTPAAAPVPRAEPATPAPTVTAAPAVPIVQAEAATSSAGTDAAPVPEGMVAQREDWIVRQDPHAYTLQLFSVADQDALLGFIRAHPLGELAYFEGQREGYPWYSLIHGIFPDAATARAAAAALPAELRLPQPWVRRLSEVQALIATQRAPVAPAE